MTTSDLGTGTSETVRAHKPRNNSLRLAVARALLLHSCEHIDAFDELVDMGAQRDVHHDPQQINTTKPITTQQQPSKHTYLAENCVGAIEPRGLSGGDEELCQTEHRG